MMRAKHQIDLPLGWTPPKYGFQQQVRIYHPSDFADGVFGIVIGLNYDTYDHSWSYEIEVHPDCPMYHFYEGGDTEMVWEERLQPLEVLCHG